ncbi:MAG: ferrous iron transporter B [Bdellovibrionaceae bacterium]|nr:ferrous iron transporter B [Pseudobdellovibrionaceae bacterium]MDW8191148.1 ferrous iron transporter B [Pseudobdellovibrionaceae bacterium]
MKKVVLLGMPNSGKSTLFNELTGLHSRIVNYPGSTVDVMYGRWGPFDLWDLPGVYSLNPVTDDERLALSELQNAQMILVVIDLTQLHRQAQLIQEVIQLNRPFCVVFTMSDLVEQLGVSFPLDEWVKRFGIPAFFKKDLLRHDGPLLIQNVLSLSESHPIHPTNPTKSVTLNPKAFQEWSDHFIKKMAAGTERWSLRWDRLVLHPVWGLLIFFLSVWILFATAFWLSQPFSSGIEQISDRLKEILLALLGGDGNTWVTLFFQQAFFPGLKGFLTFVPQIFFLFLVLHIYEGSGYLARASLIMDRIFRKFGISGRSFVPLMSGYGCAIPAILATRSLASQSEKTIVRWMLPLLTCSARVPIFVMIVEVLFASKSAFFKAAALAVFYVLSFFVGMFAGSVVHKFLQKHKHSRKADFSFLAIELPWYRRPSILVVAKTALLKSWDFVRRAGPIIFVTCVIIFSLSVLPIRDGVTNGMAVHDSYLGRLARFVEPMFQPMGVDGDMGIALLASFVAREVFVSTLASIKGVLEEDLAALGQTLNPSQALALGVFFLVALQCASTIVMLIKEGHGWYSTVLQVLLYNLSAYGLAVVVYHIAELFSGH